MRTVRVRDAVAVIAIHDAAYPSRLRTIYDPPSSLYVRGDIATAEAPAVAIVGARRPTAYGVAVAQQLARELAGCGVTVISGLARGIDAAAHRGALDAGGLTIAVLGCGPDVVYPSEHRRLMDEIIGHGAVVSEFEPGAPPRPAQFPQRNRIISGLSLGIVVVEGRENSGALITADAALEQGREVFAVPGRISDPTSRAPNRLLQQGARLVARVDDILDELHLPARGRPVIQAPVLDEVETVVLARLDLTPVHLDRLVLQCGLPVASVSRALVTLECRGLVAALPGARYARHDGAYRQDEEE